MTFRSKIDAWLVLMGFVVPVAAVILAFVLAPPMPASTWAIAAAISALALALPVWLFISTVYIVENEQLLIRSGPFRWRINLAEITSVEPSRSLLSSPALSLDRLKIHYANHRVVLVSPKDQQGFIRALGR